jgi:hypothetical protein
MTGTRIALAVALALGASACAHQANDPATTADRITRAVYSNDIASAIEPMDDATAKSVTRSSVGELSDRMHALGDFKSLTQKTADPDTGRYEYDAQFSNGMLLVQLRVDPSGKVGAYRIAPEGTASAPASTHG